jgi:hypothetical protein
MIVLESYKKIARSFLESFQLMLLIVGIALCFSIKSWAQEVIEVTRQEQIAGDDASAAKQALMEQAVENVTFENIKSIIGEEKTNRTREQIQNKIIKDADRYILYTSGQNFAKNGSNYVMDVSIKISLKGLRAILLEQGLLYQMDGPPKVLPIINIIDRVGGRSYGWWYQNVGKDHLYLSEQLERLHNSFRAEFQKIGFYSMAPLTNKIGNSVPEVYRGENLQRADYLFLGEYFKSSIVIRGNILFRLKPKTENIYVIDVNLEALHSGNGRLMAEVIRSFETDPGNFKTVVAQKFQSISSRLAEDMSAQLTDAWKKGTFGASIIRLSLVGNVSPLLLDEFKRTVVLQVKDIKSLRERLIESGKTTYEADSSALPQKLAQVIKESKFAKFKVGVEEVTADSLTLSISTLDGPRTQ